MKSERDSLFAERIWERWYALFAERLSIPGFTSAIVPLREQVLQRFAMRGHGELSSWLATIEGLPVLSADRIELDAAAVGVTSLEAIPASVQDALSSSLMALYPWRKGPYALHGVKIDTEWRSDWKWDRLRTGIAPLKGRRILDVGCGNGYHCWRMLGAGAELALGIDPTQLYVMQFMAVNHFIGSTRLAVLPLGIEDLPAALSGFDSVFSMGVLYHRRSPIDHLMALRGLLRRGGELVLETLVLDGEDDRVLVPPGRYAQMRNVWFIPTPSLLCGWLRRCGYKGVRVLDVARTTLEEQRGTEWMRFQSLEDFLDPLDPALTIEGLPGPRRAILVADA